MKTFVKNTLLTFTIVFGLSACASNPGNPTAQMNINAAEYLNPNINGEASPVVVSFYQLKTPYTFKQASYNDLSTNSANALGPDLIDKTVVEVRPNTQEQVTLILSPSTAYIGVMAAYRYIDQVQWHQVIQIPNESKKTATVTIDLESQGVNVKLANVKHAGLF